MAHFQQNQLQFNVNVPVSAGNLAVRYAKPQPFQIERISQPVVHNGIQAGSGGGGTNHFTPSGLLSAPVSQGSFQFSVVSEDKLNMAVQLAKRDLRLKKAQPPQKKTVVPRRSPSPKASRTRVVHGKEYWDRMNRWQSKGKKTLPVREHDRNRAVRTNTTQTVRTVSPPRPFLNTRPIDSRLPATTNSPPTRDTDNYPKHKAQLNLEGKSEIEKVQMEIESYLQQILVMAEKALREERAGLPPRGRVRRRDGYLSDEEGEDRRAARAEEFVTRTSRNLYNLRQQVRQVQQELQPQGAGKGRTVIQGQSASRLAAAFRHALRTLQAFVNQLPYQNLRSGLPSSYTELSELIQQLASVNGRLHPDCDRHGVQQQMLSTMDQVEVVKQQLGDRQDRQAETSISSSPPRKRMPVSRQLFEPDDEERVKQIKMQYAGKENQPRQDTHSQPQGQTQTKPALKPRSQAVMREVVSFPEQKVAAERKAMLRAGLTTLLRERQQRPGPKSTQPGARPQQTQRTHRDAQPRRAQPAHKTAAPHRAAPAHRGQPTRPAVAWEIPMAAGPAAKKSLILPAKLQTKRQKAQKAVSAAAASQHTDAHYADPTIAANLKAVSPLRNLVTDTDVDPSCSFISRSSFVSRSSSAPPSPRSSPSLAPPWSPPGRGGRAWQGTAVPGYLSPSRSRSYSPPPSHSRSRSPSASRHHVHIRDVSPEVIRELFPSERAERRSRSPYSRSYPQPRGRSARRIRGQRYQIPEDLIQQLEQEIRRRLLPDLTSAEDSRLLPRSMRGRGSPARPDEEGHRERVVEGLVGQLLGELEGEMQDAELQSRARKEAVTMQDLPTLENLMQRLEQMEQERLEIRQRWASVSYDQHRPRTRPLTASDGVLDRPRTPPALEVTRQPLYGESSHPPRRDYSNATSEEPLIFTNAYSHSQWNQRVHRPQVSQEEEEAESGTRGGRHILTLPPGVMQRIVDNRDDYDRYLKRMSHHPSGRFDPWKLVEEISDHILSECMVEVSAELEDLNEAVANQMFKSEFLVARSESATSTVAPSPDAAALSPQPTPSPNGWAPSPQGGHQALPVSLHQGDSSPSPLAGRSPSPGFSPTGKFSPDVAGPVHPQSSIDVSLQSHDGYDHVSAKSFGQYDDDDDHVTPVEYQDTEEEEEDDDDDYEDIDDEDDEDDDGN